jgi:pimeloyl-ACP methyl ester carboxylesterase
MIEQVRPKSGRLNVEFVFARTLKLEEFMPTVGANNIQIAYETFGAPNDPPLIMIMGLVSQMIDWPDPFCRMLAQSGFYVIRFDNRDVGLSSKMESLGIPDLERLAASLNAGKTVSVPYHLEDMAADTWGLMDALGIRTANICGISMGGMIAQIMALAKPERTRSLICMQTTTGEKDLPPSTPEATEAMMSVPPAQREAYLDYIVGVYSAFCGHSESLDRGLQRRMSAAAYDRMWYPIAFSRQMAAILAAPGRRKRLRSLDVPALVIHGDCDTLLPLEHGQDLASAIARSELLVVKGLGHGLAYPTIWEQMANAMARFTCQ